MTRWVHLTPHPRNGRGEGGPSLRRRASGVAVALGVTALAFLASCSSVRPPNSGSYRHTSPPPATYSAITAEVDRRGAQELAMLESGPQTPGSLMRQAFIRQENSEFAASVQPLNQVLFGNFRSDAEAEAIARWLRARASSHLGEDESSHNDLLRARKQTQDPRLIAAIEADLTPTAEAPKKRPKLAIYSRDQWRARNANAQRMNPMGAIKRVTLHHSATAAHGRSMSANAGAIRGIQLNHQESRGWGDIGYHYLIDVTGRIWVGRPIQWQGAHAGGPALNQHNVGICLLGDFTRGAPPAEQLRAMEKLVRSLCLQHGIPARQILTHSELRTTDCPGPYLEVAIQRMRGRIEAEHLAAASPR